MICETIVDMCFNFYSITRDIYMICDITRDMTCDMTRDMIPCDTTRDMMCDMTRDMICDVILVCG